LASYGRRSASLFALKSIRADPFFEFTLHGRIAFGSQVLPL
jgi:hypothetical protein